MSDVKDLACVVLNTAKIKPRPEFDPLPDFLNALKDSHRTFWLFALEAKTTYEVFHYVMGFLSGLARAIECTLWAMSWASIGPCNMELCARTQLELEGYLVKIKDLAKRAIELIEEEKATLDKIEKSKSTESEKEEEKPAKGGRRLGEEFDKLANDMMDLSNEIGIRLGPIISNLIVAGRYEPGQAPNAVSQENGTEDQ